MPEPNVRIVGRYALYGPIAAGGMATVHLGRLLGPVGFSRTVAIKRLHAQFASDPEFVSMFLDEARLAARIRHPNVVPTLDVVATEGELFLVMDYVHGDSLSRLARALRDRHEALPLRVLSSTMAAVLSGLHAAHEAKDERGLPLGIVHRDVSPQNVLIGTDGVARVLDFGVAKAAGRVQTTKDGQIKGKLAYMPPEQLRGAAVTRQTDIYAVGVMFWELVTGERLFGGDNEGAMVAKILEGKIEPPSQAARRTGIRADTLPEVEALDATILRALAMDPDQRFTTAREMALEIERLCPPATPSECGEWVETMARTVLNTRAALVAEIESNASLSVDARDYHVNAVLTTKQPNAGIPPAPPSATGPHLPPSRSLPPYFEGPPVTQPSSISVAMPRGNSDGGLRTAIAAIAGVLLAIGLLGGVFIYRASRASTTPAFETPSASTVTSASAAPPVVTAPASVAPIEATPVDAGAPPTAKPASTPAPRSGPRTSKGADPRPAASDDCSPPYWFDATGLKKYKPQCFK